MVNNYCASWIVDLFFNCSINKYYWCSEFTESRKSSTSCQRSCRVIEFFFVFWINLKIFKMIMCGISEIKTKFFSINYYFFHTKVGKFWKIKFVKWKNIHCVVSFLIWNHQNLEIFFFFFIDYFLIFMCYLHFFFFSFFYF